MKIKEVSERSGMLSDTLRYYERIGLIPPVNRNGSGIRDYNELDVKRVEFVKWRPPCAYQTGSDWFGVAGFSRIRKIFKTQYTQ